MQHIDILLCSVSKSCVNILCMENFTSSLQSREDEMGTRVWEIQKELEELQQKSLNGPQVCEKYSHDHYQMVLFTSLITCTVWSPLSLGSSLRINVMAEFLLKQNGCLPNKPLLYRVSVTIQE